MAGITRFDYKRGKIVADDVAGAPGRDEGSRLQEARKHGGETPIFLPPASCSLDRVAAAQTGASALGVVFDHARRVATKVPLPGDAGADWRRR